MTASHRSRSEGQIAFLYIFLWEPISVAYDRMVTIRNGSAMRVGASIVGLLVFAPTFFLGQVLGLAGDPPPFFWRDGCNEFLVISRNIVLKQTATMMASILPGTLLSPTDLHITIFAHEDILWARKSRECLSVLLHISL
jgi:hypothetical protein